MVERACRLRGIDYQPEILPALSHAGIFRPRVILNVIDAVARGVLATVSGWQLCPGTRARSIVSVNPREQRRGKQITAANPGAPRNSRRQIKVTQI